MNTAEKIRAVANVFLEIERREQKWGFLTFKEIQQETGIPKEESLPICELFKKEGLISYEFQPFGDGDKKFSIFDRDRDSMDETGAIRFFTLPEEHPFSNGSTRKDVIRTDLLQKLAESQEKLERLAHQLTPNVSYNPTSHHLICGDKTTVVRSSNQRVICAEIFSKPAGTIFLENDIALLLDPVSPQVNPARGYRGDYHQVYNLINQINIKIEGLTGVPHHITFESGRIFRDQVSTAGRT
ncbi:MAG: hypothetical protein WA014_01195 [Minisyncoccia bacterium]